MADKRVSFEEFVETYKNATAVGLHRHSILVEVDDKLTLDLYYYELCVYADDDDSPNVIIGHPAYTEEGLERYIEFLHDMGYALADKIRKPVRPAAEPEEFTDEIWDALLDSSGEVVAHESPVTLKRWLLDHWADLQAGSLVRAGATGESVTIYEYLSDTL